MQRAKLESHGVPTRLHLRVDPDNYEDGVCTILSKIRPEWKREHIKTKIFSNGITNKMLGFTNGEDKTDTVLIRINGNKTEIFLDRDKEVNSFQMLHHADCAPNLYCIFDNGLSYEYIPGETTTAKQIQQPEVYKLVAKEMVKMHKIPVHEQNGRKPAVFSNIEKFLNLIFSPEAPPGKKLDEYNGPSEKTLREDAKYLMEHLSSQASPLMFCHNDLLLNNIIHNSAKNSVHFIDYEYAGINFQAFDIANHFCEFAGVDNPDYSLYPNEELQKHWLRTYLESWKKDGAVTNHDIEKLYVQVNKFALAAHFMWGVWSLVQAKYSCIDFDFIGSKYGKKFVTMENMVNSKNSASKFSEPLRNVMVAVERIVSIVKMFNIVEKWYALQRLTEFKSRQEEFYSMQLPSIQDV